MQEKIRQSIPEFIYGSVDGTVTTFAIVAAAAGAGLSSAVVLVLGIANLIADGFSMGASSYLSAQVKEKSRENSPTTPLLEGVTTFSAFVVVGSVPLVAYVADLIWKSSTNSQDLFLISAALTAIVFILIGVVKAHVEKEGYSKAILSTLLLGGIAASLAYFAGNVLARLLGVEL